MRTWYASIPASPLPLLKLASMQVPALMTRASSTAGSGGSPSGASRVQGVKPYVATRRGPAGALITGPRAPHQWLREHDQPYACAAPGGMPRQLPAPRPHQGLEATCGARVPGPPGLVLAVPHPALEGATAHRLVGGTRPTVMSLCRLRPHTTGQLTARAGDAGFRTRKQAGIPSAQTHRAPAPAPVRAGP